MKIIVGSENPTKISAVEKGFSAAFPDQDITISGVAAASGVSDQPVGREETIAGALNRAKGAMEISPDSDFFVGLEGGVEILDGKLAAYAWVIVISRSGVIGKGEAGVFFLPESVSRLVESGTELGTACDLVFGVQNSKHTTGTVGILTQSLIDRTEYYKQAVILALIPHMNPSMPF